MKNYLVLATISLMFFSTGVLSLENECGELARINGASYAVSSSGGDDTALLQCVLDSAVSQGIETIKLDRGTFRSQSLSVVGFQGVFEGTTRSDTILLIENRFAFCADSEDSVDRAVGLITFFGGSPAVKSMTIDIDRPCDRGNMYAALRFTQESCEKRSFFGAVDRVDLDVGLKDEDVSVGVLVSGDPDCLEEGKGPLGTFKLNRSSLQGINVATATGLLGAGQVDINFNEFLDVVFGVALFDVNQNTTITGNTVQYYGFGVVGATTTGLAPSTNRTVVHNNSFEQLAADRTAVGVFFSNGTVRANHSAVITGNTFDVLDNSSEETLEAAIAISDVDGAVIANNRVRGSADLAVLVQKTGNFETAVESTSITGNTFNQENSFGADILLSEGVSRSVVGPQGATTIDSGTDNFISD